MEELAVIDYNIGEIHLYKVPENSQVTDEYLDYLEHRGKDCYFMIGEHIKIVKHESA